MTWGFVTCGPNEALVVSGNLPGIPIAARENKGWSVLGNGEAVLGARQTNPNVHEISAQ